MGALSNAVTLRADPVWRDWLITAGAYQARVVLSEATTVADHDVRMKLARDVAFTPASIIDLLVTVISTDPEVAVKGATPELVTEATVLAKVAANWTAIAKLLYGGEGT
jgi:hypothetical protein